MGYHTFSYYVISIQYILSNPNSPVPLRKNIVRISEFVRISEIALFPVMFWGGGLGGGRRPPHLFW